MLDPMSSDERRRAPRYDVTFRLATDDGGEYGSATVINVSRSGALLQADQPLALGSRVTLVPLGKAGAVLFDVPAVVVRYDDAAPEGKYRMGLHFADVDEERGRALERLCLSMPPTPDAVDEPARPEGGPKQEASEAHLRIRERIAQPSHERPKGFFGPQL